ncbi:MULTISPECIES: hypothetical protein [Meiothermus]|jgi:hypothetical protein|uniref:Uncharacterized protein n=3 Tax=Meiothermus TaxID=65551 RepID=D3PNC6_MEIRD|nr:MULTISPECIES: hypothetical protein [Meiothermus]ADD27317.1 hypothetical protein Mrub_0542 [Meiothermus ruber DSM 1279]AGK03771.1 hypothetical protein K649_02335 [Meiothermus ruber DSM 1279]PZA07441.1 hypothetical protein DNA98_07385 [Meiothermus sp. Pnk-1]RIH90192.1 hypothetical protein Mlute_00114 [Meiothermus luteus]RYM39464.1 hypothetical protein EWH23_02950 [Meiothermus sp. PNK-Is4]
MPKAIHEGTRVRFVDTDHPEDLACFLRHMAASLGEEPLLDVSGDTVVIECQTAPRMLEFLEGCLNGRLVPVWDSNGAYFRERGPMN